MLYLSIASAFGLVVQPPAPQMPVLAPMAEVRVVQMPSFTLAAGPTSRITSFEDELEKEAAAQLAQQAKANAQRAARLAAQAEIDAAAEKKAALAAQLEQEKVAKFEAAQAKRKEAAEAAKAEKAAAKAEKEASAAKKAGGSTVAKKATSSKYGEVQKVNKQADRIAERIEKGEEAPSFFGL